MCAEHLTPNLVGMAEHLAAHHELILSDEPRFCKGEAFARRRAIWVGDGSANASPQRWKYGTEKHSH